ncbi:MAG TPA: FAD-dependent oxidoreductase [Solirubrobacteraceae bacterium]|nr:FAD-dependent oxidoreductase [Solirubrobacteraceae bacterium]
MSGVPGARASVSPDVVIVGAGIIGAACAYELAGAGARVTVLERGDGWGEGCSWGNAGLIVPCHARPIAAPESLRAGLRWMLRRSSPFGLRLRPSLAPWLARYLRASTSARAAAGERLQRELCVESLVMLRELSAAGIDTGFGERGLLAVYTDHPGGAAEEAESETGRARGAQVLTGAEARELEPALTGAVRAGVLFPHEADLDPVRLARSLGAAAVERGAELRTRTEVRSLRDLRAGHIVLAAGAWSGRLAATAGVRLPMQGGKGYAVEWEPVRLTRPLYLHDQRCVANPLADRVRMTGGLILDGLDERFDPRRAQAVRAAAAKVLNLRAEPRLVWHGLRPCTPDGLPVIGSRNGVILATGHGMLGVTLAPLTGRLVADLVAGRADHPALGPLSPERF